MERKKNKGFTLVELAVVLVILAILAGIAVPALLGYIDKSKVEKIMANGKLAYQAAMTLSSDRFTQSYTTNAAPTDSDEVVKMAGVPGTVVVMSFTSKTEYVDSYTRRPFIYLEDGIYVRYENGEWTHSSELGNDYDTGPAVDESESTGTGDSGNTGGSGNTGESGATGESGSTKPTEAPSTNSTEATETTEGNKETNKGEIINPEETTGESETETETERIHPDGSLTIKDSDGKQHILEPNMISEELVTLREQSKGSGADGIPIKPGTAIAYGNNIYIYKV